MSIFLGLLLALEERGDVDVLLDLERVGVCSFSAFCCWSRIRELRRCTMGLSTSGLANPTGKSNETN